MIGSDFKIMPIPSRLRNRLRRQKKSKVTNPKSEAMNTNIKNPFKSKTIWGAILVVVGLLGKLIGVDVPKAELVGVIDTLGNNWETLIQIGGSVLAVYGRFKAERQLSF